MISWGSHSLPVSSLSTACGNSSLGISRVALCNQVAPPSASLKKMLAIRYFSKTPNSWHFLAQYPSAHPFRVRFPGELPLPHESAARPCLFTRSLTAYGRGVGLEGEFILIVR